jgi:hypothetical protein
MTEKTIYEYNDMSYYTGNNMVIGERGAIPPFWTDCPLPVIPDGQYAVYNKSVWVLTPTPQPEFQFDPEPALEEENEAINAALPASATLI